ncbi:MAG: glycosyltransferase family 4 protein [candidate division WOR-3 bacterium]
MKVLYITTAYPRNENDIITPWLVETIRRLQNVGVTITVFTSSYAGLNDQIIFGTPVKRFRYFFARWERLTHEETAIDRVQKGFLNKILAACYLLFGTFAIWRFCRRNRFDIIHIHWPLPHFLFGYVASRVCKAPTVISFHGAELMAVKHRYKFLRPFLRWSIARANRITANSNHTVKAIQEIFHRPVDIIPFGAGFTIPNTQNLCSERMDSSNSGWLNRQGGAEGQGPKAEATKKILFVGRLVERKGVKYLIEATAILAREKKVELHIVGQGPELPLLQKLTKQLALEDKVIFHGQVSTDELRHHYQTCDVFVLPAVIDSKGDTEGLGVVIIEAMNYKKPVVASAVGGITDLVINEKTGLTVPPGDSGAIAKAIKRLIEEPELASLLSQNAFEHIQANYSWNPIIARLFNLYQELLFHS